MKPLNLILASGNLSPDPDNSIFQHEYGHYIQSQNWGPLYFVTVGIPSGLNLLFGDDHKNQPYETEANRLSFKYFKHLGINLKWDCDRNPFWKID